MFCSHCNTPFVITPLAEGKSRYCKNCGNLIYKKEKDAILIYHPDKTEPKQEEEQEIREHVIREKELRYKEQLERKQKELEFRERLEQERIEQERVELERKRKEKEEQERLFQLQAEEEKRMRENLLKEQLEKEREERQRLENELVRRKEQDVKEQQEKIQLAREEKERQEKEQKHKQETARINLAAGKPRTETILIKRQAPNKWFNYALPLLSGVLLTVLFIYFRDKIPFLSKTKTENIVLASADTNLTVPPPRDVLSDTLLMEQLKANISGRSIVSWDAIKATEIKKLSILSADENATRNSYTVSVNLSDHAGTKATAELILYYNNIILDSIETLRITYANIAPVGAWFSFAPLPDCTISVNTNNNPIQLKTCLECNIQKMVSNKEMPREIQNTPKLFIKSDNKFEALVEFTYVPVKNN